MSRPTETPVCSGYMLKMRACDWLQAIRRSTGCRPRSLPSIFALLASLPLLAQLLVSLG